MHNIDLSKYDIHSDLIIENDISYYNDYSYSENNINVSKINLSNNNILGKKKGDYITITFDDITDEDNYSNVLNILNKEIKDILKKTNIKKTDKCLIVGLGNNKSTPDSLGYEVIKNITVTRHLYLLENISNEYRVVSCIESNVMANTGIESKDIIMGIVKETNPDFLIAIDSLSSSSIDRINKTIQITNTGIHPGSGIGNNRVELSFETLNIPVIAIGVPTVVSSAVIVNDTINYLIKKINYHKNNLNNQKNKFAFEKNINYLKNNKNNLNKDEKINLLGILGTLNDNEIKELIYEILNPIGYNLIVTTKEIDFIIEKLGKLISDSLNTSLHFKK